MRKEAVFVLLIMLSLVSVGAVSTTLEEVYAPRETMIGEIFGEILAPIGLEQVRVVRDRHIESAFEGDVKKLGDKYFVWMSGQENEGGYTLIIEDIVANVGGYPQVVDFRHDFKVEGDSAEYSIKPGLVFKGEDFVIEAIVYGDIGKNISVSYPFDEEVVLKSGTNIIKFELGEFVGNKFEMIDVGQYVVPAYLLGKEYICGDGEIDGKEKCDDENLNGKECSDFNFDLGELTCEEDCLSFDKSDCEVAPVCGFGRLDLCAGENECLEIGAFWYDDVCNRYEEGAECDSEHFDLCESEDECLDAGGYWGGDECNLEEEIEEPSGEVRFEFYPRGIKKTFLFSEEPVIFEFRLVNLGGVAEGINLDYNKDLFNITPDKSIILDVNGSVEFELSLKNVSDEYLRGAVVAYSGNKSDYILFEINFTENEEEVGTEYIGGVSAGSALLDCSEHPGEICTAGEVCNGEIVLSRDSDSCCLGWCEKESGGSKSWIGYLIAGIIILVLLIVFVKYKKTGKVPRSPTQKRFAMAERKIPGRDISGEGIGGKGLP
ncbi:MAG: hypothetical protein ABIG28_03260 [archaeon]